MTEEPPLLPDRLRRPALAVAGVCGGAVGGVGVVVAGEDHPAAVDRVVVDLLGPVLRSDAMGPLALATHPVVVLSLIAAVVVVASRVGRPRLALLAAVGPAVAVGLNTWVLKPLFDRTLGEHLAYPSGHTTSLVSVLAVVILAAPSVRAAVAALGLVAVAACAIVGLGYHYPTDIAAAVWWAVAAVIATAWLVDRVAERVGDARSRPRSSGNAGR